jgi:predicted transcriptional regulator
MTLTKEEKQQRTALLKELREQHADTIEHIRERLKAQKALRRQICAVMEEGPKTIPEIAEASELPSHEVLWHVTAMKKYDLVVEVGQSGEYYQYAMAEEAKS